MNEPADPVAASERLKMQVAQVESNLAPASESAAIVELDQNSVGHLSRMDARYQQAMARASLQCQAVQKRRIVAALDCVAVGYLTIDQN